MPQLDFSKVQRKSQGNLKLRSPNARIQMPVSTFSAHPIFYPRRPGVFAYPKIEDSSDKITSATHAVSVTSSEVTRVLDGVNKCIAKQHALAIYWVLTLLTVSMSTFSFVFQVARYIKIFADTTSDVRNWPAFWQEGVEFELSSSMKYKIPHFWFFFGLLNLLFCIVFYLLGKRMVNTVIRKKVSVVLHCFTTKSVKWSVIELKKAEAKANANMDGAQGLFRFYRVCPIVPWAIQVENK